MNCEEFEKLAIKKGVDQLTHAETHAAISHLRTCDDCRGGMLKVTMAIMANTSPDELAELIAEAALRAKKFREVEDPETPASPPRHVNLFEGQDAPGAFPRGTRVRKVKSEKSDGHQNGSLGTVGGSMDASVADLDGFLYAVFWDDHPELPIHTVGWKLEKVT